MATTLKAKEDAYLEACGWLRSPFIAGSWLPKRASGVDGARGVPHDEAVATQIENDALRFGFLLETAFDRGPDLEEVRKGVAATPLQRSLAILVLMMRRWVLDTAQKYMRM